jgi:hypothetical protein
MAPTLVARNTFEDSGTMILQRVRIFVACACCVRMLHARAHVHACVRAFCARARMHACTCAWAGDRSMCVRA